MSWFRFLRRPTRPIEPPLDLGGWHSPRIPNEGFLTDWRPGDLGRCTLRNRWFDPHLYAFIDGPKFGEIVRVTDALICCGCASLVLRGWPGAWQASSFVKIDEKGEEAWLRAVRRKHAPQRETEDA